jgi:hypothetical protein
LQALYVQQDAVESLVQLNPHQTPRYAIEDEPEAAEIRSVRNCAVGHPTVQGNVNSRKTPGVQMSYHISQPSMRNDGLTLMTTYADGSHTFTEVNLFDLIERNRAMVERILQRVKDELEAAEIEHRKRFRSEKLVDLFSAAPDYHFEKVYEGVRRLGTGYGEFGKLSLEVIMENVKAFRDALTKRGALNASSNLEYFLAEVEYPLGELKAYFESKGSLKDPRDASIFTHFLQDKAHGLLGLAKEIDDEYAEELEGGS